MDKNKTNLTYLFNIELFSEGFVVQPNKVVGINFQEINIYLGYLITENGTLLTPVFVKEEDYFKIDHTFPYIFYVSINNKLYDYTERLEKLFKEQKEYEQNKEVVDYYVIDEYVIINNNISKYKH